MYARTHTHTHTHTHRYAQLRELKEEGIVAAFELVHGREVRLYWRGMGAKETKRVRLSTVVFEYQCFFCQVGGNVNLKRFSSSYSPLLSQVVLDTTAATPGAYTGSATSAYLYYTDEYKSWAPGLRAVVRPLQEGGGGGSGGGGGAGGGAGEGVLGVVKVGEEGGGGGAASSLRVTVVDSEVVQG